MFFVQTLWSDGKVYQEFETSTLIETLKTVHTLSSSAFQEATHIRAITLDGDVIFRLRKMKGLELNRRHFWPLGPSPTFPGESAIYCPRCDAARVTMTGRHAHHGTAPGGRGRMGDPGGVDILLCEECHFTTEADT